MILGCVPETSQRIRGKSAGVGGKSDTESSQSLGIEEAVQLILAPMQLITGFRTNQGLAGQVQNFVRIYDQDSGRCRMKYRIAIWAAAGFLVASGWAVYFFLKDKDLPIEPLVSALLRLTCPIAIVGMHYPVSIYSSLAANVATYAVVVTTYKSVKKRIECAWSMRVSRYADTA